MQQTVGFRLSELGDGDTGPVGQHLGNVLVVHDRIGGGFAVPPLLLAHFPLSNELLLVVAQSGGLLEVLVVDGGFLAAAHLGDLVVELTQVRRRGHTLNAQAGTGLIDQVDGLIRQVAVGDVTGRQVYGAGNSSIGDSDLVMLFVAVAQALENVDSHFLGRLRHLNGLEAALQCGILLNVLVILVHGGGANALNFTTGETRLQNVGSVRNEPSAAPAPTRVWISSMKIIMSPRWVISLSTFFIRSSKSPR